MESNELFLDRSKIHYIKDKDKRLEVMFDGGMKMWYVRLKYNNQNVTFSGSFYSRYFQNEMELCKEFPAVKDYMKEHKFNEEMKDIINSTESDQT